MTTNAPILSERLIGMEYAKAGYAEPKSTDVNAAVSWTGALAQAIGRWYARVEAWRRVRRNVIELSMLDDRLLADIGLHADDIDHLARHGRFPYDNSIDFRR